MTNIFSMTATLGLALIPVAMLINTAPVHAALRVFGL